MDAKAIFKVKRHEFAESTDVYDATEAILFGACLIAAAVGNGLEALTKAITDNTEEYRGR